MKKALIIAVVFLATAAFAQHTGGGGGSGSGNCWVSGGTTANVLPKSNGSNQCADSLVTDDGTTLGYTGTQMLLGPWSAANNQFTPAHAPAWTLYNRFFLYDHNTTGGNFQSGLNGLLQIDTADTGLSYAMQAWAIDNKAAGATNYIGGIIATTQTSGGGTLTQMTGVESATDCLGTNTCTFIVGYQWDISGCLGTCTNMYGFYAQNQPNGQATTNKYLFYAENLSSCTGTAGQQTNQQAGCYVYYSAGGMNRWEQGTNGYDVLTIDRATDTSPTGNFLNFKNAAGASVFTVGITGSTAFGIGTQAAPSQTWIGHTDTGWYNPSGFNVPTFASGNINILTLNGATQWRYNASEIICWATTNDSLNGTFDVNFYRSAANTLRIAGTNGCSTGNTAGNLDVTGTVKYQGLPQTVFVTSDFTTSGVGTALEAITGLTWTFPANVAMNVKVDCYLDYNQNVATAAVAFGFQDATVAPTNLASSGIQYTSTTAATEGTTTGAPGTVATPVVSATPSVITTVWPVQMHMFIEQPSNASTSAFTIRVSTATAADTVTVKRGGYCTLQQ